MQATNCHLHHLIRHYSMYNIGIWQIIWIHLSHIFRNWSVDFYYDKKPVGSVKLIHKIDNSIVDLTVNPEEWWWSDWLSLRSPARWLGWTHSLAYQAFFYSTCWTDRSAVNDTKVAAATSSVALVTRTGRSQLVSCFGSICSQQHRASCSSGDATYTQHHRDVGSVSDN